MKIVPARISHLPQIFELWKEFIDYHRDIDPHYTRRKDAVKNFEKYIRQLMKSKDARVIVALEGEAVIGFSTGKIELYPPVFLQESYGFIDTFGVKSCFRRKGVGEKMLKNLFAWFKKRGLDRIELRVAAKNRIGYSFWKKQKFKDYLHILYLEENKSENR